MVQTETSAFVFEQLAILLPGDPSKVVILRGNSFEPQTVMGPIFKEVKTVSLLLPK